MFLNDKNLLLICTYIAVGPPFSCVPPAGGGAYLCCCFLKAACCYYYSLKACLCFLKSCHYLRYFVSLFLLQKTQ